jgi:hypothetical protein
MGTIRETDGDAVCCWLDSKEIARDFEKCPVAPESIIIGGEGEDILE